jgi:hypothetical protein
MPGNIAGGVIVDGLAFGWAAVGCFYWRRAEIALGKSRAIAGDPVRRLYIGYLHDTPAARDRARAAGLEGEVIKPQGWDHFDMECPDCGVLMMLEPAFIRLLIQDGAIARCRICADKITGGS